MEGIKTNFFITCGKCKEWICKCNKGKENGNKDNSPKQKG